VHVADYVWYITVGVLLALLAFDVFVIGRRPHEPSTRESATAIAFYIGLAVVFGLGVWFFSGGQYAGEFFAGWLTEYSLSVDNLFIFLIIMSRFAVPRKYQQTALLVGIILALVFRGVFIAVGAAAINQFSWVFYIFGAFLVYTAIHLAKQGENDDDDFKENAVIRFAKKRLNATDEYNGVKLTLKKNGKRLVTPMAIVIIALGTTDLLFALDSIPAIYGLTQEPFLVAFIGVKLVLHAMHVNELPFINGGHHIDWAPEIPIWFSLGFIIVTLGITTILSLRKSRTLQAEEPAEDPAPELHPKES
jgi:tellurite resistance protein TerC